MRIIDMRPLTWWERAWALLQSPFAWTQCKATLPFKDCQGYSCCVRTMGHFGKHQTNNGERFV